ncbi:flagellar hook-length control protein FliK [Pseudalkalibacillus salsuginis]|uniref:flagellar hook-length control protein FliK n=1 Tax=Pseudalkalibacillus salsuginis TaxID=2910972 RepID=UPI001F30D235|nr:flagellar hook-length control protein FliK [Pseudalkalibacillus salsuginis]MCF6410570.1 flagellar hook-length control protein FliK [Pseudalkalibacillus salsuginis]
MTVVANMMMNTQILQGYKMGQTNHKEAENAAFSKVIVKALEVDLEKGDDLLTGAQLLNRLEEFRAEVNEQNGTDLSLEQLIEQLHQNISQPFEKSFLKTMPILDPLHTNTGQHVAVAIEQGSKTASDDAPVVKLFKQSDLQLLNGNARQDGLLQTFVKFLMKNDTGNPLPQVNKLNQMLKELQGKLDSQPIDSQTVTADGESLKKGRANQVILFNMKNQPVTDGTVSTDMNVTQSKGEAANTSGHFNVNSPSAMTKVEQFILHAPQEHTSTSHFANELGKIINRGRILTLPNGSTQLSIKLFPENLGSLDIQIVQRNGEIAAKIIASTAQAKELIESNLHQLRHSLQGQNLNIDKIEIASHTPDWMNDKQEREKNQQFSSGQHNQEHDQQDEHENQTTFDQFLKEMGIDEEV